MKSIARIRSRNSRNRQTDSVPMTPMIDVVFQMLIYFVLTFDLPDRMSQMQVWHPGPPEDKVVVPPTEMPTQLGVGNGQITWDGQVVSIERLEMMLNRVADLNPKQPLLVMPSKQSTHRELVTVLNLTRLSKLSNISVSQARNH